MNYIVASIWDRLLNKRGMTSHNNDNKNGFIPNHKKRNVCPRFINTPSFLAVIVQSFDYDIKTNKMYIQQKIIF